MKPEKSLIASGRAEYMRLTCDNSGLVTSLLNAERINVMDLYSRLLYINEVM